MAKVIEPKITKDTPVALADVLTVQLTQDGVRLAAFSRTGKLRDFLEGQEEGTFDAEPIAVMQIPANHAFFFFKTMLLTLADENSVININDDAERKQIADALIALNAKIQKVGAGA